SRSRLASRQAFWTAWIIWLGSLAAGFWCLCCQSMPPPVRLKMPMQYRSLGSTGLNVSLLGLGSGGASRLGQRYELPASESGRLVRHALDAGVNFIDTAPSYGHSEDLLAQALV